jgi:hypothetical protein
MAEETDFDTLCDRLEIPANLRKHIQPGAPSRGKMAVARGMLPMPPKTLLAMTYFLLGDGDPQVSGAAEKSLLDMPEERMLGLVDHRTHPKIVEFLAYKRLEDKELIERIVLMRQANDKTLCYLAERGPERVAEMIANNQERLITTPQLLRFLGRNPNASAALVDRVKSFQRLQGIDIAELDEERRVAALQAQEVAEAAQKEEARQRGASTPPAAAPPPLAARPAEAPAPRPMPRSAPGPEGLPLDFVPGEVYIPPPPTAPYTPPPGLVNPLAMLLMDWGIPLDPSFVAPPEAAPTDYVGAPILTGPITPDASPERTAIDIEAIDLSGLASLADSDFTFSFREDQDEFADDLTAERDDVDEEFKQSLAMRVSKMTTGQKIKLAYKGNKTVRELLVRDTNKIVAVAVIKSGRITDNEVKSIATNRAINEDCIRALADNREYLRKYPIKVALANNPKTPISVAMSLLKSLHVKDLKGLANNRNVSAAVFSQAAKLYKQKKAGNKRE